MALQISVGAPQLVLHHAETVWIADPDGQLSGHSGLGLLFRDTRLISTWSLFANGTQWELLNGAPLTHFAARIYLANAPFRSEAGDVPARSLSLVLGRWISGGVHEDLDLTNHSKRPIRFTLDLLVRSDFADVFELKGADVPRRGRIGTEWSDANQRLRTTYANEGFLRGIEIGIEAYTHAVLANGRISFDIDLAPGATWHACLRTTLIDGNERIEGPAACAEAVADTPAAASLAQWRADALALSSSNPLLPRLYAQSLEDMAALRLPFDGGEVPAAGLPWFLVLFGRDSLIVSLQCLPVTQSFARGTLRALGNRQATAIDDRRDAEPGKIMHEIRRGELAYFKTIPHTPYYGTADATALYLILLHQTWRWSGDRALVEEHLATAEACLSWIDCYGDRDGDGLQEYATRSPQGYENMGWKDAGDSVVHADGSLAKGPKALCELQAYTYAGWRGMADIFDVLGNPARATELRDKAAVLYNCFNDRFWDEALGCYVFALDGDKRPVRSIVSNVGHCLWAGIVRPDRARRVVERLLAPDMFSGWGIRTLSAKHPAFNPLSYHNGSVWPHDNAVCAMGFARYGFHAEAAKIAHAILEAGNCFAGAQMPELFAGYARGPEDFPVQYPGANVPQAWAAGSVFLFLQALLGFSPDAAAGTVTTNAALPDWLPDLELRGLRVGKAQVDLTF